jgi:glyoxylase-like metal-dependent hydrolase (beta-lactamase superfamily II)
MVGQIPDLPVLGGAIDSVEACTRPLEDGTVLTIGEGVKVTCLHTPG